MAILIPGKDLTPSQRQLVLGAFLYRMTTETRTKYPTITKQMIDGGYKMPEISDDVWIRGHSFWFDNDGKNLSVKKKFCEPYYPGRKD